MSGLFGAKKSASQSSKAVSALQVQTSTSGQVLPLLWGCNLIAGNLGWFGNWVPTPHTSSSASGGKGGSGSSQSSTSYTYTTGLIILLTGCPIGGIGTIWNGQDQHNVTDLGMTTFTGATPQTPWAWLASYNPAQSLAYSGMSYVAASALNLGSNTSLPNFNFEILGQMKFGAGFDALPSDIVTDYLTNVNYGAGFGAYLGDTTNLANYCKARSLLISPIEDQQRTASSFMDDMAAWCNFACVWSYKQLNLIPYGDTAITSQYGSYTPNVSPLYDLGADDFLYTGSGTNGVELDWASIEDCYNMVAIEYNDRSQGYNTSVQTAKDQADIDARGPYPMSSLQVNGITTAAVARDVAQLMLQRSLYIRKTYSFSTTMRYMLLEPMDIVTLTDPNAGLSRELVRITKVSEQDDQIDFEAEELPIGVAHAPIYGTQNPNGYNQNTNVAPGSISPPVIFNAPGLLTASGYETWIAAAGIGAFWGGCVVYASADNLTYKRVGQMNAPSRYGALTAAMPASGTDPDTTSTLNVAMLTGQLTAGGTSDADNWRQFAFVGGASGGEFIAFKNATLTGTESYSLGGYLRRGGYGSTNQAHVVGDVFARIDDGIFKLPYDRGMVGQTIYFKFVSFNSYGAGSEQLSGVPAYSHVIGASDVLAPQLLFDQLAGQYAAPSSGSNFIPNPGFELNNIAALPFQTIPGKPICDSWYVKENDSNAFSFSRFVGASDTGTAELLIRFNGGVTIPANYPFVARALSAPIYVAPGQLLTIGANTSMAANAALPAGVTASRRVGAMFYSATNTFVGEIEFDIAGNSSGYVNQKLNQATVPAGASYMNVECATIIYNTNGSATAIPAGHLYADAQFDSMIGTFVTAADQVNYSGGGTVDAAITTVNAAAAAAEAAALAAQSSANAANAQLASIASDGVLSAGEKPAVIIDYNVIIAEQSGIDAQATAYGITTDKAAYDSSISALSSYLSGLSPAWNSLTTDTPIVGKTFRANFASVYTARQTLLNDIYALALSTGVAAQMTATQGVGLATSQAVINGGFDVMPFGYGWTPDTAGAFYVVGGSIGPGQGPNCGVHTGNTGGTAQAWRNNGLIGVQQGQCVKAQALISANGPSNGVAYVFISWCNASGTEISTSAGSQIAGGSFGAGKGSYVIGYAPAGAVYARVCLACSGQTAGNFLFDNVVCTQYPNSVDEIADGAAYAKTRVAALVNGTIPLAGAGKALLGNPTFVRNTMGVAANSFIPLNSYACDNWHVATLDSTWVVEKLSVGVLLRIPTGVTVPANGQSNGIISSEIFPVTPGQTLIGELIGTIAFQSTPPAGTLVLIRSSVTWVDATGVGISPSGLTDIARNPGNFDVRTAVVAPANAAGAYVTVQGFIQNTGSAYTAGNLPCDATILSMNVYSVASLTDEVTGTLSTARNLPQRTVTNIPALVPSVFSYSATSTAATITLAAFTVLSDQNVSYGAMSVGVTGTAGSTITYYLYFDDPQYLGGTRTLVATTNKNDVYASAGRVYAGGVAVTYPAAGGTGSGGGGGGGGGGGCVCTDQWVPSGVQAGDVHQGDLIYGTEGGLITRTFSVEGVRISMQPCWRLITRSGSRVSASESTPMTLPNGDLRMFADMVGQMMAVKRRRWQTLWLWRTARWEKVVDRVYLGIRPVNQISIQGNCYWAGDVPGVYASTHNTSILPK